MHDVLEKVTDFLSEPVDDKEDEDQKLFDRVVDFVVNLEPDSLSDQQLEKVMEILDDLEPKGDVDEQKKVFTMANKSSMKKRQHSRTYYRRNKTKVKQRRVMFSRSIEGRKRKNIKKNMETKTQTPTGKKKTRYHPTKGGQGGKREN